MAKLKYRHLRFHTDDDLGWTSLCRALEDGASIYWSDMRSGWYVFVLCEEDQQV